jgi:hypothetical protein
VVVAALLLAAVATVVGLMLGAGRGTDASASDTPTPGTVATDATSTPPAAATEAPPPAAPVVAIPTSCADIYTRDWAPDFAPLVLNPEWTSAPDSGVHFGSRDEVAIELLDTTTQVRCKWGSPNGGSGRGLTTNVAAIDSGQAGDMRVHFEAAGYTCYEEMEGTRCVMETVPGPDGQAGESHFFRDGVWIATLWVNAGPDGYTHDIVAALFG